jgi:hypothetical protein
MEKDFNRLKKKINDFKNKFFKYHFIRGVILSLLLFVIIYFILDFLEYTFYLSSVLRKMAFMTSILFMSFITLRFVIFPGIQWIGLLKILDDKKVSSIISKLVPEIKDKLINVIELNEMNAEQYSDQIKEAAITQKINELKIFNFTEAINLKNLRILITYLFISFAIISGVFIIDKNLIIQPANRILHYNQVFIKPAPFTFDLLSKNQSVEKGKEYIIKMECKGEDIPTICYINIEGNNFLMKSTGNSTFEYEIPSVIKDINFYFTDLKYNSENFLIEVIPVPIINKFEIQIIPPEYTNLPDRNIENIGDIEAPAGSYISWSFECFDTDSLQLKFSDGEVLNAQKKSEKYFITQRNFKSSNEYEVKVKNIKSEFATIMTFSVNVKEDLFPEIKLSSLMDSVEMTRFYFKGEIYDDYGFTELLYHMNIEQIDSTFKLPVIKSLTSQEFYYAVDFNDFSYKGKTINYYFTISDNDQINKPKTTSSQSFTFKFPDRKELDEKENENFNKIDKLLLDSKNLANELKKDLKELQIKNLNNSVSEWDKSQLVNDIVNKKDELDDLLNNIEKLNEVSNNYQNSFNKNDENILKKQEEIEKLLENVMTDELKKLLEEFAKLAEEFNSQKLNDLSSKMNLTFEDLEKQLDRNIEMLKKMKIEKDLTQIVERVERIKENQENDATEILKEKQFEEIGKSNENDISELSDINEDLKKVLEQNNDLKNPYKFDEFTEEFKEINEGMKESGEELNKRNAKNASKSLKKNADNLGNLLFAMKQMIKSNSAEQNEEDIANIKQILKNLVYISFEQENILKSIAGTSPSDPIIRANARNQRKLIDQSKVVKDSLYALALRNAQINNVVNNELMTIDLNLLRATELLGEGLNDQAETNQQIVITAVNNLALLLNEVLQSIEEQMANSMPGDENCQKGGKKGNMGMLKNQSENLRQQLQKMIDELKNGKTGNQSRQLSQSMMEHEMMQKMLRELMNNGSVGSDARKQLQQIDQLLEQNRRELMNKRINTQLVQRQNEILTRLLEAEKSERERDLDNKRESNTASQEFYSNPAKVFELNKSKNITLEYIQQSNLKLNNFYQDKFKNYIENYRNNGTQ